MKSRNDIITDSVDLTFIFVKGGPIDVIDETLTTLYTIQYTSVDYPINSINFPNLTSITRIGSGFVNTINNAGLNNINLPNLVDLHNITIVTNNCDVNLQSLTFSNVLNFVDSGTSSSLDLTSLEEVNVDLTINNPNTDIDLPSLKKVGNDITILANELTCDNFEYLGQSSNFIIQNTINNFDLSQLIYVGNNLQISGNLTTDIIINSLTQSVGSINIDSPSSSNVYLDNLIDVDFDFLIITNAISLTFSNLIKVQQSFAIGDCNNLQSISATSLVNSNAVGFNNNTNLTSIDISGLTNSFDFSIAGNTSLTQSIFNNIIELNGQVEISNNSNLEVISLNSLTTAGKIIINNNSSLETIDLSSLDNIKVIAEDTGSNILYIDENNSNLKSLDISGLIMVTNNVISLVLTTGFPNLEEVILNNAVDATNVDIRFANLTQTSVDNILVALDTAGYSGGTVDLSGGTSAAPSVGTGQPAVTSLQGKGWTVTTN